MIGHLSGGTDGIPRSGVATTDSPLLGQYISRESSSS